MQFELRPFLHSDLNSLVKYANNYNVSKNLSNKFNFPYTQSDGIAFINLALAASPLEIFAIVVNNEVAGSIGVHPQQDLYCKNAEMGYWLAEPYWGNGIVPQAIKEMVNYGFKTFDITRIFARTFDTNFKSQRALEKAGFKLEAELKGTYYKNGTVYDEMVYAVRKTNHL
ncbi:GNAT family N-acetyltransferase [Pedobacter insulae]|uniref:Protein N-acetyltransferase, RimJ/RimL family n=1 Tax=Pedobacter insulae TaxID=414048 RepID=A0A1I2TSS2_9SPHI|nr:GNAT family protein [Pedobacter insulae]SFG66417.1 Protein N-acetyltransferase, RimJ/RimL family [Pedobacter insulae]